MSVLGPDLCTGITFESFHSVGKIPNLRQVLKIICNGSTRLYEQFITNNDGIPSGPARFLGLRASTQTAQKGPLDIQWTSRSGYLGHPMDVQFWTSYHKWTSNGPYKWHFFGRPLHVQLRESNGHTVDFTCITFVTMPR